MDRSNLSYCDDCLVPVPVKHIILECPNFQDQRISLSICVMFCVMGTSDMKVTFTNISTLFTF